MNKYEASWGIKTEFLVKLDGTSWNVDAGVLVIGDINRSHDSNGYTQRQFVKQLYIP